MFDQFSYEEYDELLRIVKRGHKNLTFSDFLKPHIPPSFFILRHDIDFSLDAASKMARFEAEQGVRATYFLLLSSQHYNLLSEAYCTVPRQLIASGHEVGLHYDVRTMSKCTNTNAELRGQLQYEIDILSRLAGSAIHSIAMHNPSVYGDDPFSNDNRFINAYDPQFTKHIAYYSDSCGAWRDHAYEAFQRSSIPDKLQLLIHPFYWADSPGNRWERLNEWAEAKRRKLEKLQEEVRELWGRHSGVQEHERRLTRRST